MTVASNVLKFADDTKWYRVVDNYQDGQMLQDDIDSVCDWADDWKMSSTRISVKLYTMAKEVSTLNIECTGKY